MVIVLYPLVYTEQRYCTQHVVCINKTNSYKIRGLGEAKLNRTGDFGQHDGQDFTAVIVWSIRKYKLGMSLVATQ